MTGSRRISSCVMALPQTAANSSANRSARVWVLSRTGEVVRLSALRHTCNRSWVVERAAARPGVHIAVAVRGVGEGRPQEHSSDRMNHDLSAVYPLGNRSWERVETGSTCVSQQPMWLTRVSGPAHRRSWCQTLPRHRSRTRTQLEARWVQPRTYWSVVPGFKSRNKSSTPRPGDSSPS